MSNTITNIVQVAGQHKSVIYFNLVCVGAAQETNTAVYTSSSLATTLGITDPKTCALMSVKFSTSSVGGIMRLNWDATTPVCAFALPYQSNEGSFDFNDIGGLRNQGGTGITGNITITCYPTGDTVTLVLEVRLS